jgi:hypothetical protein
MMAKMPMMTYSVRQSQEIADDGTREEIAVPWLVNGS